MPTRSAYDAVSGTVAQAADVDKWAKGWVGYAEIASPPTTSGTTPLTVLTLSTPVLASRRLRLTATFWRADLSVAADSFRIHFTYDGADVGGIRLRRNSITEEDGLSIVRHCESSAAGNKTITVVATRTGGTGTLTLGAAAGDPGLLLIEDIGAAS
jgi:hypothetical protein